MSLHHLIYPHPYVRHFDAGGTTTTTGGTTAGGTTAGGTTAGGTTAGGTSTAPAGVATGATETTVSDWAAPTVGGIINTAVDYAGDPYQVYGGSTVAGASDLQNKANTGIVGLQNANTSQTNAGTNLTDTYKSATTQSPYTGTTFTSNTTGINDRFGQTDLTHYMDPYLSTILNPQLAEARRNANIEQMKNNASMIKSGAFGGGGADYLNAESRRNLGTKLADITGKGYEKAYDTSLAQFNADQNRVLDALKEKEKSKQYGATQDLNYLKEAADIARDQGTFGNQLAEKQLAANRQMAEMGGVQRDIEQQGLTSDYNIWKEARDYPKAQLEWLQSILKQYPMTTTNTYGEATSPANSILGGGITGLSTYLTAADAIDRLNKSDRKTTTDNTTTGTKPP